MSEPEKKYTLPQLLEIVRGHAAALLGAGAALEATEGKDAAMLAMVGERAQKAKDELWEFESDAVLDEAAEAAWCESRDDGGIGRSLWQTLYALPLLVMAVEACAANPTGRIPAVDRFFWLHYEAERIAKVLMTWVEAHEKGVNRPKENGAGAHPISQPEEPQEATSTAKDPLDAVDIHYKVQEALRPLRIMADSEILMQGRYRNGENDGESDRAEDLARLAKQAYEALRTFEDTGRDPILPEARDLLWWGQAVCVALNAMALRLSEDLGSAVPDDTRINETDAVHAALDVLSKDSFERVRADGGDIEQAQAEKVREKEASQ